MQSLSIYNKGNQYLLCAIDLLSKYRWVVPLKDKKGVSFVNAFYNNSFKDFLKINNTEMYSTYNEGKSVAAETFIRTLKNKIFNHDSYFKECLF